MLVGRKVETFKTLRQVGYVILGILYEMQNAECT